MAFSKFNAYLKSEAARTVDDLWAAIARAADIFTPQSATTNSLLQDTNPSNRKML